MSQRARFKQKGRTGATFVQMPHFVLRSEQWAALSGSEVKLLMELASQYRRYNNGDLSATYTDMQRRGWRSKETLQRTLESLEASGWIIKTRQGGRHIGCSLYAISWEPVDDCDGKHHHRVETKASHLWKNANGPPKIGERKPDYRGAKPFAPQKSGSNVVPLNPVA